MPAEPDTRHPRRAGRVLRPVIQIRNGQPTMTEDALAEEVPIAVQYDGRNFAVMMATPDDLEDFAYGFSLTEGLASPEAILGIEIRRRIEGIELDIDTGERATLPEQRLIPGRSGCGICGSRSLEDTVRRPPTVATAALVENSALERALDELHDRQPINAATGSVHAAAWALADGGLILVREDVGRHNALDKLIGGMLRAGTDPQRGFLVLTSRASYEMIAKAAIAKISMIVAVSAPTALAVGMAQDCGLSLIGFARPGRHVVYAGGGLSRKPADRLGTPLAAET